MAGVARALLRLRDLIDRLAGPADGARTR
jgi:hypothetical protein